MITNDADIDSIFQNNYVQGVQDKLSNIRNNIEKKKEDLRVMVGERYRDLIEAADTIDEMQRSTQAICSNIQAVEKLCESLQQRGLIGFKTQRLNFNDSVRSSRPNQIHLIAVQVKVLVDAPEALWDLTERKQFLSAAQLFLLAQHTHMALKLNSSRTEITTTFPVISCQWSSISQFKAAILKGCTHAVKSEVQDYKIVLNSLAAMMLMENIDIEQTFNRLLDLRQKKLESILAPSSSSLAKDQLIQFSLLLMSSLQIIYKIFIDIDNGPCALEQLLKRIMGETDECCYPISLLPESTLTLNFVSKSCLEFRAKAEGNIQTMSRAFIQEKVCSWVKLVVDKSSVCIQQLLDFTSTVKALLLIRSGIESAQAAQTTKLEWTKVLEVYGIECHFNPWKSIIEVRIVDKVKQLIAKQLNSIHQDLQQSILSTTQHIHANQKVCYEEGDITSFVWCEAATDCPHQVGWATSSSRPNTGLFHKSKGFTHKVQSIAKNFNGKLATLIQAVVSYAPQASDKKDVQDYKELLHFLEQLSWDTFCKCIDEVEKKACPRASAQLNDTWHQMKASKPTADLTVMMVVSRILSALPILCPQLRVCVCASDLSSPDTARRLEMGLSVDTATWVDLKQKMNAASERVMQLLFDQLVQRLSVQLNQHFSPLLHTATAAQLLHLFATWETICIEEEDDNGKVIQSNILIPAQPSLPLSEALIKLCSSLNQIGMHSVSRRSHVGLLKSFSEQLSCVYGHLEPCIDSLNQTTCIQLMFDLKLIHHMFITTDNKEIARGIASLLAQLEARVDPFDWNVFSPHVTSRVRWASQKYQVLFGILLPKQKQMSAKSCASWSSTSTGGALVLVPSVEIARFTNVPVPEAASALSLGTDLQRLQDIPALRGSKTSVSLSSMADRNTSIPSSQSSSSLFSSWFG